ncbi:MAG: two-component sensor histidine kinase [Bacteroidetes bacterium]|nr:two-component sensor histidine kinase [Bacteroidota bacterium]
MKLNRTYFLIGLSSLALIIVLAIQVNWILDTAQIKEELFNERATIVLTKTAEALAKDTVTYRNMEMCMGVNERRKIDSLFNHYMKMYNIRIDYFFEVKPGQHAGPPLLYNSNITSAPVQSSVGAGSYQTCLKDPPSGNGNGMDLKLVFPDKEQYILEEMGIPFISSVLLIVVVIVLFWRTTASLIKEKEISEHTTDFLNNMTHEFKTPLTNIGLAGKMILKDSNIKQEDKVKHYSGIILEENEKLRLQVEQVLSMTALERGEIPLHKTEFDFNELIRDSLKCISVQIENKQGKTELNLDAANALISGDRTHFTNAICNLIDNAVKYSPEKPEITIHTFNREGELIIQISDKGIGIDKEHQKYVFEKFFRVPTGNVHNVKGFGLGLAYVKKIVELHGGSIVIQSGSASALASLDNRGTTFIIALPNG